MSPTLTCLALALVGVDLGYRPASNGGAEFIIQINPATLGALGPGEPIGIDVPREAQAWRPSHFSITLGNEQLPHVLPVAGTSPPAAFPGGPANPVMSAGATSSAGSSAMPLAGGPVRVAPPLSPGSWQVGPRSAAFGGGTPSAPVSASPGLPGQTETRSAPQTKATPAKSRIEDLQHVNSDDGDPVRPDRPWLLMFLLVIALAASNGYFVFLFWDARQQYLRLLSRKFSFGQQTAEA